MVEIVSIQYLDGDKEQVEKYTRQGRVLVKYNNGDIFKGRVRNGGQLGILKHGFATYTWASGARYIGMYTDDQRSGHARYISDKGEIYEGEFDKGAKHGKGKYSFENGDVFYGTWVNDKRQGKGKYIYANGKIETAEWKDGKLIEATKKTSEVAGEKKVNGPSILLAGAPLSGKGTQGKKIENKLGVVHVDAIQAVDEAIEKGTDLGKEAQIYKEKGQPVPEEILLEIVNQRLEGEDVQNKGFVLEHFPTNQSQVTALNSLGYEIDTVLLLTLPDERVFERVETAVHEDETEARLDAYHAGISRIKKHYNTKLVEVDASLEKGDVWYEIKAALKVQHKPVGIVIAGAPASGKGTQCEYIRENHSVIHLSTGDMLRAAVAAGTPLGVKADGFMKNGELVPDDLVIQIVADRLQQDDVRAKGFLLDGFPRTDAQAAALEELGVSVDMFVLLHVPDDKIVDRVTGRRIDPETGNSYHVIFNPPPESIQGRLIQRSDDTAEKVQTRLQKYHENINPIKDRYTQILHEINGDVHKSEVWQQVNKAIENVLETI